MGSPPDPPHLWAFLERLAVEAAYSSALHKLIVRWCWLVGFPLELGTVAGLMSHLIIRGLVLEPRLYWLHRLDVCPRSELIPGNQRKHKRDESSSARSSALTQGCRLSQLNVSPWGTGWMVVEEVTPLCSRGQVRGFLRQANAGFGNSNRAWEEGSGSQLPLSDQSQAILTSEF